RTIMKKNKSSRRRTARARPLEEDTRDLDEALADGVGGEPLLSPGKQPLASGGERIEETNLLAEEDDFEDGRSSSGLQSRRDIDPAGRGDVSSRARGDRMGVLSVES